MGIFSRRKFTTAEVELMDIRQIKEKSIIKYIDSFSTQDLAIEVKLPSNVECWVWSNFDKNKVYKDLHIFNYELALDDVNTLKDIKDYYVGKLNAVFAFMSIYLNKHPEIKRVDILQPFRLESLENRVLKFGCKVGFRENSNKGGHYGRYKVFN